MRASLHFPQINPKKNTDNYDLGRYQNVTQNDTETDEKKTTLFRSSKRNSLDKSLKRHET